MSVRIPNRVNAGLDWASRNRMPLAGGSIAAVILFAAETRSVAVAAGLGAAMCFGGVLAVLVIDRRRAREERAQAQYDQRALQNELDEARSGDPSAPTVQLRTIGEGGERT